MRARAYRQLSMNNGAASFLSLCLGLQPEIGNRPGTITRGGGTKIDRKC